MTTMFAVAPRTIHPPLLVACVGCALLFSEGVAAGQLLGGNSRRRQAINDALAGKDPIAVVESVMEPGNDPAYLAIRIAGKKALPHLYELLGERDARPYALHGILLVSDFSDPASMAELKRAAARARTANDWAEMQWLEEVIAIALAPADTRAGRLDELQRKFATDEGLSPESLALLFPATQQWALHRARARLAESPASRPDDPQKFDRQGTALSLLGELTEAAWVPHIEPASRKLMTDLLAQVRDVLHQEGVDTTDTQIALAQYLASGRDPKALDRALEMAGDDQRYGSRYQAMSVLAFGDSYLGPDDIPQLMRRASDAKASTAVRGGAIRLLMYAASADADFLRLRKDLARSDDPAVSEAAKHAGTFVIDGPSEPGGL
jgi:hypothetical protein